MSQCPPHFIIYTFRHCLLVRPQEAAQSAKKFSVCAGAYEMNGIFGVARIFDHPIPHCLKVLISTYFGKIVIERSEVSEPLDLDVVAEEINGILEGSFKNIR